MNATRLRQAKRLEEARLVLAPHHTCATRRTLGLGNGFGNAASGSPARHTHRRGIVIGGGSRRLELAARLNATLLAAACIVGLAIVMLVYRPHGWHEWIGVVFWIVAVAPTLG